VETKFDHKQVDLDLFINMWKNYSSSNTYLRELTNNGFIDRQPVEEARVMDPYDQFDYNKPFYTNWLFWLLAIIGLLLVLILVFFICCLKQTKKQQKEGRGRPNAGIVIEYPPNVNPLIYENGLISLKDGNESLIRSVSAKKNKKVVRVELEENMPISDEEGSTTESDDSFEEQELHMNIVEMDQSLLDANSNATKQV
jgi:hypothetical protein